MTVVRSSELPETPESAEDRRRRALDRDLEVLRANAAPWDSMSPEAKDRVLRAIAIRFGLAR